MGHAHKDPSWSKSEVETHKKENSSQVEDLSQTKILREKIKKLLEKDPKLAKKAALILEMWLNGTNLK